MSVNFSLEGKVALVTGASYMLQVPYLLIPA